MKHLSYLLVTLIACNSKTVKNKAITPADSITVVSGTRPDTVAVKVKKKNEGISAKDKLLMESVAVSNDFYKDLLVQNYPAATKHLHPDAISVTSFNEWIKIFKDAQSKKGKLAYVKMIAHGGKCHMKGGNGQGDYAELIFDSQYKDGNMREKLTFFRKNNHESVKILGYEYHQILDKIYLDEVLKE